MGRRILGVALCLGLLAALWNGVSCYSVPEPNCGFICSSAGTCPDQYFCAATGVCERNGASDHCYADAPLPVDASPMQPTVVSMSPVNGAITVPRSSAISATFDQDVVGVDSTSFVVTAGPMVLEGTYLYDAQAFTWTFMPGLPMPPGAMVMVALGSGIHNDLGVPLSLTTWGFTTLDDVAPTLATSSPADMDTNVETNAQIIVAFSEPVINVNTTSFTVAQGATPISGTIAFNLLQGYVFTPDVALPAASLITVTLGAPIEDTSNNALVPVSFSFTTM